MERKKKKMPEFTYRHFDNADHREAMKKGITNLIQFAREKKVKTVLFPGLSAQVARVLFKHTWLKLHPNEPVPQTITIENEPIRRFYRRAELNAFLGWGEFKDAELLKLDRRLRRIVKPGERESVLVLDENINRGSTLHQTKDHLERLCGRNRQIYTAALIGNYYNVEFYPKPSLLGAFWLAPGGRHFTSLGNDVDFFQKNKRTLKIDPNTRKSFYYKNFDELKKGQQSLVEKMKTVQSELRQMAEELAPRKTTLQRFREKFRQPLAKKPR